MLLSPFELGTGLIFGADARPSPLPGAPGQSPVEALEQVIFPALLRPPCLVSFSGGRDSSAVLAIAAGLARRHGLAPPIPATNVFAGAPAADEEEWQTQVVAALQLTEWLRIRHTDELDVIGPYAKRVLRRHGLLWPFNAYFHLPVFDAAAGGSVITGVGGDEVFAAARMLRFDALRRRVEAPAPKDVLRLGFAAAPARVRRAVIQRREPLSLPWMRAEACRLASSLRARDTASEPRTLAARMAWWQTLRYLRVGVAALDEVAQGQGTAVAHPLLSPAFWAAVARSAPWGFSSRTEGMRRMFGDSLPEGLIARRSKAHFDEAFWTDRARAFAHAWTGGGISAEWVEEAALARHWREERPLAQSFFLLQGAWLHAERSGASAEAAELAFTS